MQTELYDDITDTMHGFEPDDLDYRGPDYFDAPDEEDDLFGCEFPDRCLMPGFHLRGECHDLDMVRMQQSEQEREEWAKNDQALLNRLRQLHPELEEYAYGKAEDGERFIGWVDIADAMSALERAINELHNRLS